MALGGERVDQRVLNYGTEIPEPGQQEREGRPVGRVSAGRVPAGPLELLRMSASWWSSRSTTYSASRVWPLSSVASMTARLTQP